MHIPNFHSFKFPARSTLISAIEPIWEAHVANGLLDTLTEENWGMPKPKGPVMGGFLNMERDFDLKEVQPRVEQLAKELRKKVRLGTPEEAFHYKVQHKKHFAAGFIVPSILYRKGVIHWVDMRFMVTYDGVGKWDAELFKIFVVQESTP